MEKADVVIIGAGAAGLMCAIEAGKRHRKVIVLEQANKVGKKIIMSGGGRCNFTNYYISPDKYISHNPHFCKSALTRYTQWNFIDLVKKYHIPFHEKTLGQLFCDHKSQDIVDMLLAETNLQGVEIRNKVQVESVNKIQDHHFRIKTNHHDIECQSLVIASGGLSIPSLGSSPFGYKVAEQFGLKVWPTRAGLVPFTLHVEDKARFSELSGIGIDCLVKNQRQHFRENILFTHRGLSGPAILQISSYWKPGEDVAINMLPDTDVKDSLITAKKQGSQQLLKNVLFDYLPKRVIETFLSEDTLSKKIQSISNLELEKIANSLQAWILKPNSTEGYRTAEVTIGGVDCDVISSKTMEANKVSGLYFIGEVLDVSGWLGGYNFQWAWSSGWVAGQVV